MIKVNGKEVVITRFPDNTFKFDLDLVPAAFYGVEWIFESMEELFTLQALDMFLGEDKEWELSLPYIPNARMDKVADEKEGFMLKYFANIINSLNFKRVYVDDPHSEVSKELIDNLVERKELYEIFIKKILDEVKPDLLVFPDAGARDRYAKMPVFEGYDIAYGIKERNQKTGEIINFDIVGDFNPNTKALIVDDICSRGGTFHYTAEKLVEKGINDISLVVTHLEDTIQEGKIFSKNSLINGVYAKNLLGEWDL